MMTRSPPSSTYDDDFFVWTQEQAAALRRADRSALGSDLDIENLAEEIEDLGRRDLREVRSYIRLMLEHVLKITAHPDAQSVRHWRAEVRSFHENAIDAFTPGMLHLIDLDEQWSSVRERLRQDMREAGERFSAPVACPLTPDDLLADDFALDAVLAKMRAADRSAS